MAKVTKFFMKALMLCVFICTGYFTFGQNSNRVKILPVWKVNDFRNIHVEVKNQTSINDSVIRSNYKSYDVLFKVIEINEDILVRWTCVNDEDLLRYTSPWENPDHTQTELIKALESAKYTILTSEMTLRLNTESGKAEEWVDGLKTLKNSEFQEKKKLRLWYEANNIDAQSRVEMEITFSKILNSEYEMWRKKILDKATTMFEQYNKAFSLYSETTETIYTTDLLSEGRVETDFPANCVRTASELNNRLTLKNVIEYDQKFLLHYLQITHENLKDIGLHEILVVEREKAEFDLSNNWITHYTKNLSFEVKGLRSVSQTEFTFK